MTSLLALDISSTNIGWTFFVGGQLLEQGTIELKDKALDVRLRKGSLAFYKLLSHTTPTQIAFEDAAYRAHAQALIAQQRMVGCMYAVLTALNMPTPVLGIAPAAAKKTLTGKGNADKGAMMAAAKRASGRELGEHEADAFAVGVAALTQLAQQAALEQAHLDSTGKVRRKRGAA